MISVGSAAVAGSRTPMSRRSPSTIGHGAEPVSKDNPDLNQGASMYGDNPPIRPTSHGRQDMNRNSRVRRLLTELDRREAMAVAALPSTERHFGWANLPTDSGLTEPQEDFIDYWAPQRVIDECRSKRALIPPSSSGQRLLTETGAVSSTAS